MGAPRLVNPSRLTCQSGKLTYYTEPLANRAISKAIERGEIGPLRHYQCPDCGYWHLSRKTSPPGRRDNA